MNDRELERKGEWFRLGERVRALAFLELRNEPRGGDTCVVLEAHASRATAFDSIILAYGVVELSSSATMLRH
jgi:hypothetical protein